MKRLLWIALALLVTSVGCAARSKLAQFAAPSPTASPFASSTLPPLPDTPTPSLTPFPTASATVTWTREPSPTPTQTATTTPTPVPPPRVVASYPIDGDRAVRAERALVVEFDRPMDKSSVSTHLAFSPTVEGKIDWPTPQRFTFMPGGGWTALSYEVILASGSTDIHGVAMQEEFCLRFARKGHGAPVPILMYHNLKKLGDHPSEPQLTWTVSPDAFVAQMTYLAQKGWQSISPAQLAAYLTDGEPLPRRAVMITMDDGYKEVYTLAYPLFAKLGFKPVLFIVPQYMGYGAYMDWGQLQELVKAGFIVGSHGYDHANLQKASDTEVERQIGDSQSLLARRLGGTIDAFAYPYGYYDKRALVALEKHHYVTAFTINPSIFQSSDHLYQLNRMVITYTTGLEEFAGLLLRWPDVRLSL